MKRGKGSDDGAVGTMKHEKNPGGFYESYIMDLSDTDVVQI